MSTRSADIVVAVGSQLPSSSVRRLPTYTAPTPSIWCESAFPDKVAPLVLSEDNSLLRGQTLHR